MIDITSPKVLVPTILFALLSPSIILALPPNSSLLVQTLFHALVLGIISWVVIKFVFKLTITSADLVVPMILFVALTPGVLLTIPPINGKLFLSSETGVTQVMVHTFVFSLTYALLRGTFPSVY